MSRKAVYFEMVLGLTIFLVPRATSQDFHESPSTRETLIQRGTGIPCKVIGASFHSRRYPSEEISRGAGDVSELRAAEQFMRSKAAVYADLNRLEEPRAAKLERNPVRDVALDSDSTGRVIANHARGRSIAVPLVKPTRAVLSVSATQAGSSRP